jgi:hypothetical protein
MKKKTKATEVSLFVSMAILPVYPTDFLSIHVFLESQHLERSTDNA